MSDIMLEPSRRAALTADNLETTPLSMQPILDRACSLRFA